MTREQAADENNFRDKETKGELEVQEKMPLLEWLANSYKKFGCVLYNTMHICPCTSACLSDVCMFLMMLSHERSQSSCLLQVPTATQSWGAGLVHAVWNRNVQFTACKHG